MKKEILVHEYKSPNGFSIQFPENWKGITKDNVTIISLVDELNKIQSSIIIKKDNIDSNVDLNDYSKVSVMQIRDLTSNASTLSELVDIKISDMPGKSIAYKYRYDEKYLKSFNAWILNDKNAFSFAYTSHEASFEAHIKIALRIIYSFKLT